MLLNSYKMHVSKRSSENPLTFRFNKPKISLDMRRVVLVFFGVLMPFVLCSQGNLQFNQVLLLTATGTVPSGKVCKVESVLSSSTLAANNNNTSSVNTVSLDILVDGITVTVERSSVGIASQTGSSGVMRAYWGYASGGVTRLPFWLPAGSTLAPSTNAMGVSVIEFNVLP